MFTTQTPATLAQLTIQQIHKSYGLKTVLHNVSLILNAGERIGLVGANGVGKSTLLKIAAGELAPDEGTVMLARGRTLGYLAQVMPFRAQDTLDDLIAAALDDFHALEADMRQLEAQMETAADDDLPALLDAYGEVTDAYTRRGGYTIDTRLDELLTRLGVAHIDRDQAFGALSGGEKARVGLALLLVRAPDVLLLDEPTNHLDHETLDWLETYLADYPGAALIVSHDRQFLDRAVNAIVEIDEHTRTARRFNGNYSTYAAAKAMERVTWERDYEQQQEEIKTLRYEIKVGARQNSNYRAHADNDKFVRNIKIATHQSTVSKRIRDAEQRLARIEADPIPQPPDPLRFRPAFDPARLKGQHLLIASNLSKTYGERCLLDDVSLTIEADSRILLTGPNGSGKTTLLRLLLGLEAPDAGTVWTHAAVKIGYLAQEAGRFDPERSLFEVYRDGLPGDDQAWKSELIQSGLFRYDDFATAVGVLSSGQRRKLQIARLIAERANLLVLDEPTNDVSFDVLEGLEAAIRAFPGPVIASSHDRRFMADFGRAAGEARSIYALGDGRLRYVTAT
ncbi:MAG: ABC-F family ATP-binding cassette domain-containing protein [Anaerolineae bacterium]|nr:ABC-F family ATP-binding cassette domain-containing protein [Anaerolineae bacterium]